MKYTQVSITQISALAHNHEGSHAVTPYSILYRWNHTDAAIINIIERFHEKGYRNQRSDGFILIGGERV